MKLPKLKYYYYAMTSDAYIDFAVSRTVEVSATLTIDLLTGAVTGRTMIYLTGSATEADTNFRELMHWTRPVYVLRIPRDLVDRKHMKPVKDRDNVWEYRHTLVIPHCGVERIELDTATATV